MTSRIMSEGVDVVELLLTVAADGADAADEGVVVCP
jgi:hypothetical protein